MPIKMNHGSGSEHVQEMSHGSVFEHVPKMNHRCSVFEHVRFQDHRCSESEHVGISHNAEMLNCQNDTMQKSYNVDLTWFI